MTSVAIKSRVTVFKSSKWWIAFTAVSVITVAVATYYVLRATAATVGGYWSSSSSSSAMAAKNATW